MKAAALPEPAAGIIELYQYVSSKEWRSAYDDLCLATNKPQELTSIALAGMSTVSQYV
jgi:hypothetical protein